MKRILLHPMLIFLVALLVLPYIVVYTGGYVDLATSIIIYGLLSLAFNFMYGHTGDLSFGHGMFFAISGYIAGNLALYVTSNWLLGIVLGVAGSMLVGVLVGAFAAYRSKGIYFAMITLAIGQVVFFLAYSLTKATGGENGLSSIPKVTMLGLNMSDPVVFYYTAAVLVFLGVLVLRRITNSPFGKISRAISHNKHRPEFLGVNVNKHRFFTFVISTGFAGFAGVLNVFHISYVSPFLANWTTSGEIVMMSVLGGINDFFGPFLGAFVFRYLEDILSAQTKYWFLPLGVIFVFFVLLAPNGIYGLLKRGWARLRSGKSASKQTDLAEAHEGSQESI